MRIDIVTSGFSKIVRDWIDLLGHIFFLMPFCLLMVYLAWPFFFNSFNNGEISLNAGGLVIWPAKLLILCCFVLLTAQAISEIIKRIAVIRGLIEDPTQQHELPPMVEELESAADLDKRMSDK